MVEKRTSSPRNGRLLASRRRDVIRQEVERHGGVRVRDLVELLSVSEMTIRRDIDKLHEEEVILRVHGGAASRRTEGPASSEEPGFVAKSRRQFTEKVGIASAAADLVKPGSSIGITAGTTTAQLASLVNEVEGLLIVTNSIAIADLVPEGRGNDSTVVITGGMLTPSRALVGPVAEAALENLHLDQIFLGVHGMTESAGYTSPNLLEAQTLRRFVDTAQSVVVMADHTKWGTVGLSSIGSLDLADTIITDSNISDEARSVLQGQVKRLIVAE